MKIKVMYENVNDDPICLKDGEVVCKYLYATDETCTEWECSIFGELGEDDGCGSVYPDERCLKCREQKTKMINETDIPLVVM